MAEKSEKKTATKTTTTRAKAPAKTTYGTIGVKAWVYKGEIEPAPRQVTQTSAPAAAAQRPPAPAAPPPPPVPQPARVG